jgi:hypothetical protein
MNVRQTGPRFLAHFALAVAAALLAWQAQSPRDSLIARLTRWLTYGEGPWELGSSIALVVVVGIGTVISHRTFAWRIYWFLMLIVMASGTFHNARFERLLMLALLAGLALAYRRFVGKLSIYLIGHPSQSVILVLFFCLLYGLIGLPYGVPNLFWYDTFWGRFWSAFGSTLLLAVLGVNSFFLDDNYRENWKTIEGFLKEWGPGSALRAQHLKLGWLLGDPSLENDPNKLLEEPKYGAMISSLLRAGRLPMLTLISLPALFPLMFPSVPRQAPRAVPSWLAILDPEQAGTLPDVGRDLRAWLLGLACWGLGILAGIFFVKPLIRAAMWLEDRYGLLMQPAQAPAALGAAGHDPWRTLLLGRAWFLYLPTTLLALGMTVALDVGWEVDDRSWIQWVHIALLVFTMVLGVALSAFRACQLRLVRWPPFFRFLFVSSVTLAGLALWDSVMRRFPDSPWAVSPGMAVCALLAILAIIGAWLAQLRPVRDTHAKRIAELERRRLEMVALWDFAKARRIRREARRYRESGKKRFRSDLLAVGILGLWVALMNAADFKLRFEPLPYRTHRLADWKRAVEAYRDWARDFDQPQPRRIQESPELLGDATTLEAWRDRLWSRTPEGKAAKVKKAPCGFRPKLVVVCATGGASRAAYWTARVLQRLGEEIPPAKDGAQPGFHDAVRLITGASGGMVGAAHYLARRKQVLDDPSHHTSWWTNDRWIETMPTENLPAVASHIALIGVGQSLLPRLPHPLDYDRGQALEDQWPQLQVPFSQFREAEGRGELPSLVFTPVTVDDGRRLLVSNLGLHRLVVNRGSELDIERPERPGVPVYSVAAPEFYRVFGASGNLLTLATATRMSATFPMVSPAVNLPTVPPIRVVDAGYYDNFGVNIAVAWLFHNSTWLAQHTSGVVLVQVRAFMGRRERLGPALPTTPSIVDGLQFFSTSFEAFAGMRESMPMFRNDEEVAALADVFHRESGRKDFFTTVIFENSAQVLFDFQDSQSVWPMENAEQRVNDAPFVTDVAMTWYLSPAEKSSMRQAIPTDGLAASRRLTAAQLKPVVWGDHRSLLRRPADRLRWLIESTATFVRNHAPSATRAEFSRKELERALNYERIQALKAWWAKSP